MRKISLSLRVYLWPAGWVIDQMQAMQPLWSHATRWDLIYSVLYDEVGHEAAKSR